MCDAGSKLPFAHRTGDYTVPGEISRVVSGSNDSCNASVCIVSVELGFVGSRHNQPGAVSNSTKDNLPRSRNSQVDTMDCQYAGDQKPTVIRRSPT